MVKSRQVREPVPSSSGGGGHVTEVLVLSLVRDSAVWVAWADAQLGQVEARFAGRVRLSYVFYENDSRDQTRARLQEFVDKRPAGRARLITGSHPPFPNLGVNFERTRRLADLRNALLDAARPLRCDFVLLLDADVMFDGCALLERMLGVMDGRPDVGMVTAYSTEAVTGGQSVPGAGGDLFTVGHYYDTFAFVDASGHSHWPRCVFRSCKQCECDRRRQAAVTVAAADEAVCDGDIDSDGLLEVRSAYGGFALVRASVLQDPRLRWDTVDLSGKYALCEHVLFCERLRLLSGKRVVVDRKAHLAHWLSAGMR